MCCDDHPDACRHRERPGSDLAGDTDRDARRTSTDGTSTRSVAGRGERRARAGLQQIPRLQRRRRQLRRRLRWRLRRRRKLTQAYPQHKLISKVRDGAKVSKKHDTAATPFHRATDNPTMAVERIVALTRTYSLINPAATQRQIQALTTQLFTMTTSKAGPTTKAQVPKRARSHEATNPPSRAS